MYFPTWAAIPSVMRTESCILTSFQIHLKRDWDFPSVCALVFDLPYFSFYFIFFIHGSSFSRLPFVVFFFAQVQECHILLTLTLPYTAHKCLTFDEPFLVVQFSTFNRVHELATDFV